MNLSSKSALSIRLRKELAGAGVRVSVNDFVVKAAATALQYVPEMNLNVSGEDFEVSFLIVIRLSLSLVETIDIRRHWNFDMAM